MFLPHRTGNTERSMSASKLHRLSERDRHGSRSTCLTGKEGHGIIRKDNFFRQSKIEVTACKTHERFAAGVQYCFCINKNVHSLVRNFTLPLCVVAAVAHVKVVVSFETVWYPSAQNTMLVSPMEAPPQPEFTPTPLCVRVSEQSTCKHDGGTVCASLTNSPDERQREEVVEILTSVQVATHLPRYGMSRPSWLTPVIPCDFIVRTRQNATGCVCCLAPLLCRSRRHFHPWSKKRHQVQTKSR